MQYYDDISNIHFSRGEGGAFLVLLRLYINTINIDSGKDIDIDVNLRNQIKDNDEAQFE